MRPDDVVPELKDGAVRAPGDTAAEDRGRIQDAVFALVADAVTPPPDIGGLAGIGRFVQAIEQHAAAITDQDVDELRAAGHTDAAILEITINAAVASGLARLEAVKRVWREL